MVVVGNAEERDRRRIVHTPILAQTGSGRRSLPQRAVLSLTNRMTTQSFDVDSIDAARDELGGVATAVRFYVLAFAFSWVVWGSAIWLPDLEDWEPLIIIGGAYGPLLAAIVMAKQAEGVKLWFRRVAGVRRRMRWILIGGLGLPLVVAVAHVVLYRVFVDSFTLSNDPPWYWAAAAAPVNIWLLFWLGSAMEEFGWQGVAVPALTERLHPLAAAGLHGVVWGTWHLPLFWLDSWAGGDQSIPVLYAITVALSPIMMWLTRSAAGGVMPAVLFHAATNHYTTLFTESDENAALFDPPLLESFTTLKLTVYFAVAIVVATRLTRPS